MARSGDTESEIWGTWEDLLLACAVSRHGNRSWESVAMEVQARSPAAGLLTPQDCRQRYHDLERRFGYGGDGAGDSPSEASWVEELRKLRVAELRREVERYDVSIGSLQLKVRRLKEERERNLLQTEAGGGEPDLNEKRQEEDGGSPGSTPDACAGDRGSVGDSGGSCKESNSTDPKEDKGKPGEEGGNPEESPGSGNGRADPATRADEKAAGEGSYNGSSDTIAKGAAPAFTVADVNAARPRVGESGESVAGSKEGEGEGEGEGEKDSSDVQSSASLSKGRRRGRRRKAVSGSSSVGEEREADVVSVRIPDESQPLVSFLEIIRSHKFGSVFERRLESQESVRYRCLIRQHVDLEMVRAKLERGRGGGAYTSVEFFRDLLLLCNNAIVFYPKSSPESVSAVRLRELVATEMSRTVGPPQAAKEPTPPPLLPPQPPQIAPKSKLDPDIKAPAPLIACRNHGSISANEASPMPAVAGDKEEKDVKHDPDRKEGASEDAGLANPKTKLRSGTRGLRTSKSRARSGLGSGDALVKIPTPTPAPAPAPNLNPMAAERLAELSVKAERKSRGGSPTPGPALSTAKKRGAATFLNRLNRRSPPSSNGTLLETVKGSSSGSGERGQEQKKAGRGDGRKDQVFRKGPVGAAATGKQVPEKGFPVKRSVGRPPKRAAPPPLPPPAKRTREEVAPRKATPPPRKKRGRK